MKSFVKYNDREISWLQFNERVLQEAKDISVPLIERIIFLGIFSNNLDEFFRVRVASLNRLISDRSGHKEYEGINPKRTLKSIGEYVEMLQKDFVNTYTHLIKELKKQHIFLVDETEITETQQKFVYDYFRTQVRLHLFPMMLDKIGDHIIFKEESIYLAIELHKSKQSRSKTEYAVIEIPTHKCPRFLILPQKGKKEYVMFLDDVIRQGLFDIFSPLGYDTFTAYTFKFTRDAELEINFDPSKNVLATIYESVQMRQKGAPVRFIYDEKMPNKLLRLLIKHLKVKKKDIIQKGGRYHNNKDLMSFPKALGNGTLIYNTHIPIDVKALPIHQNIFEIIDKGDLMLHYPYQSFQNVIDLLREASLDPDVNTIRMAIYRISRDSSIMNALINAARNGKKVIVYLEAKARFDEENNIHWANKLHEEGVKVLDVMQGMKVHAKMIVITAKKNGKEKIYSIIGTGNPNEDTAKIYTDKQLLTSNKEIGKEAIKVFQLIENPLLKPSFKHLLVAPFNMRSQLETLINKEIANAKAGKPAWITLKMNNITDRKIIEKLYEANNCGIKIKLLVRGICVLNPGIKGLSENIEVISIVDRFLEHARIFVFCNNNQPLYFVGSADLMRRNLDYRIEVATPIYNKDLQKETQKILDLQLEDNTHARIMHQDTPNQYKRSNKPPFRSQEKIYAYLKGINA